MERTKKLYFNTKRDSQGPGSERGGFCVSVTIIHRKEFFIRANITTGQVFLLCFRPTVLYTVHAQTRPDGGTLNAKEARDSTLGRRGDVWGGHNNVTTTQSYKRERKKEKIVKANPEQNGRHRLKGERAKKGT